MVPRAGEILALWEDTLHKLHEGDLSSLVGRLDWVLKLHVIERSLEQRSDLEWESPELKYLDLLYSSLDPAEGLYWAYRGQARSRSPELGGGEGEARRSTGLHSLGVRAAVPRFELAPGDPGRARS